MNILYFCDRNISPLMGGTERITLSVSNALRNIYGCKCFLAYTEECDGFEPAFFDGRIRVTSKINTNDIRKYIVDNDIKFIIIQNAFSKVAYFRNILGEQSNVKIILCYHFAPGWDTHFDIKTQVRKIWRRSGIKNKIIAVLRYFYFHLVIPKRNANYHRLYKEAYDWADKVVLLSDRFINGYANFGGLKTTDKLLGIPNMLSFSDFLPYEEIASKSKTVLIVSRLDEEQKRISYALKIWELIKKDVRSEGWKLQIIGHGDNEEDYKNYASKRLLTDIEFLGRQNPVSYYKRASIFMLTSRSEGWGLTLTESQQFGVVPLAFNSYESVVDIIDNGENGFIIEDNDLQCYAEKVLNLMQNDNMRSIMAQKAIQSSHRFEASVIAKKWYNLLEKI